MYVYHRLTSGNKVTKANKDSNNSYGRCREGGGRNRFGFSDQRSEWESDASARLVARRRICWRGIPDCARSGSRRLDSSTARSPAQTPARHLDFAELSTKYALSYATSYYWKAFGRLHYDVIRAYLEPTRWVRHLDPRVRSEDVFFSPKTGLHTGVVRVGTT